MVKARNQEETIQMKIRQATMKDKKEAMGIAKSLKINYATQQFFI